MSDHISNMYRRVECTATARKWRVLATEQDSRAQYEHMLFGPEHSTAPFAARAELYRRCAEALDLEAATGIAHCVEHLQPAGHGGCAPRG